MGGIGYAAANGNFLPFVYFTRRFWLPTARGVQSGSSFSKSACLWQTSTDNLHGVRLQCCGVIGCRIIDSPRERLIAILTNNFAPCNGRLPTIIALITMFFVGSVVAPLQSAVSALMLVGVIVLGVAVTFLISRLLSGTILKGIPSSFTLELPPYRRPQIGKVIIRSIFDRTLFVLGRAVVVAAPAGLIIWLAANVQIGGNEPLDALRPFPRPPRPSDGVGRCHPLRFYPRFSRE